MTSELGNTDKNVEQLTVEGESGDVQGFFMVGDVETNRLDGVGGVQIPARFFYLPVAREDNNATTLVYLISQDSQETALVSATLHQIDGNVISTKNFEITPNGSFSGSIGKIFGEETELADGYIKISSSAYLSGYEIIATEKSIYAFSARRILLADRLFAPHFIAGAGNDSEIRIMNNSGEDVQSVVTLMDDSGQTMVSKSVQIGAARLTTLDLAGLLKEKYDLEAGLLSGSILVEFDHQAEVSGTITMSTSGGEAVTAMPLASQGLLDFVFPQVAQSADGTIFMGFAIMNPGNQTANATLSVYNDSGVLTASKQLVLPPLHRITDLLSGESFFGSGFSQMGGHIKLTSDQPLVSVSIYGDYQGRYLSTVEGQLGEVETAAASAELERSMAEEID